MALQRLCNPVPHWACIDRVRRHNHTPEVLQAPLTLACLQNKIASNGCDHKEPPGGLKYNITLTQSPTLTVIQMRLRIYDYEYEY